MSMFKAGLSAAAVFIGAIAAVLGLVLTVTALKTSAVSITYGEAGQVIKETVTLAGDAARYWRLVGLLGLAPMLLGGLAMHWGLKMLRR